ncbi:MAG: hypothetical protein NVS3B23_06640 [Candidatus Saccharimonadales bacterium]
MSARRYDDNPKNFYKYIRTNLITYEHHGMQTIGPRVSVAAFTIGYIIFWPMRRSYNAQLQKRSLKQLVKGHRPRKNPMK